MNVVKTFTAVAIVAGLSRWTTAVAADDFILRVESRPGSYCHLKFPSIEEATLFTDKPVLQEPGSAEIVDYYGPCAHDPLGKDEVQAQRRHRSMLAGYEL
jgi:hypothetical protein